MSQDEKLNILYNECVDELRNIGIDVLNNDIGEITIKISKRNNKRYGCCRQELPDKTTKYYEKIGRKKYIRYARYGKHTIEISKWVMELHEKVIKNTIVHELIHCMPYCNNHGEQFKKYSEYINNKLGYNITRIGNKKEDYENSNIKYNEEEKINYKIICEKCKQTFYRQRLNRYFEQKYRCGKCGGKFIVYKRKEIHDGGKK